MFPAQTSFIPVTVALSKFIEANGFGGLYPYWYFGTTPVKYLIGPVAPGVLVVLHKFLPDFSLFDLSLLLVVFSGLLAVAGWGLLAARLSESRRVGWWVGILTLLLPWHWFAAFGLSEVSAVLATSMTPWVLLAYARIFNFHFAKANETFPISNFKWWLPPLAFALLLLTNSTAAIPAIVGLFILAFSIFNLVPFSDEKQFSIFNKTALIILIGWLLVSLWYGFDYWLTIFGAPSVGGKSIAGAFATLLNSLRSILPVLLAIVIVLFGFKLKERFQKFAVLWLTVFLSLTLMRFMADPDFWMDWTSWASEVEVGIALAIAPILIRSVRQDHSSYSDVGIGRASSSFSRFASQIRVLFRGFTIAKWLPSRNVLILLSLFSIYLFGGWFIVWNRREFWMPRSSVENTVEYRIAKFLELETGNRKLETGDDPVVFLSGTTTFWLNSLADVMQVRGGRDEVSKNANWRALNWQLTQGENLNYALASLAAQGVDFIVVHNNESGEYYHDFKSPQDFESIGSLEKVYEMEGDIIYRIK